jgi:anti-sigma factor ChrR (cupin superfamily)
VSDVGSASIHGDLTLRVRMNAAAMEWQPSPSGTVWRKRLHLVGGAETGQVTSIVRYDAGSRFPAHDHPDGEEILVLEGVFSDEHGDWPAGTYLLNPEGFRHAPFSRDGCLLFVKLRQYAGSRHHVALRTDRERWQRNPETGIEVLPLYSEAEFPDTTCLERWAPGTGPSERAFPGGAEILVLRGGLSDDDGDHQALCWLRLPLGSTYTASSPGGCELYVKRDGLGALREHRPA